MITFNAIQLRRGSRILLDNASATINPGQKIGLVGKNGCGKSTLLSLLKNEISTDAGSVSLPAQWRMAWVDQHTPALEIAAIDYVIDGDREFRRLERELEQANLRDDGDAIALVHSQLDVIHAWSIRARAGSLLQGLGFSPQQLHQPVKAFSGGWRMRLNLAQALLCPSELLLLDEPTNHLDLDAVIWLEKWLKSYSGTLILISHDRDFLDPLVNKILHIEQQNLFEYTGNYSDFERQRAMRLLQQQALYTAQRQRVAHLQSYIDRFRAKASKAKQAQSRLKMLERMEMVAPAHLDNPFQFSFPAPASLPVPLLQMENVSAGYTQPNQPQTNDSEQPSTTHIVLNAIKLNLVPGSRIGLLGRNGAGKSTLIKLLAGELTPISGNISLAKGVTLGYFAQHQLEYLRADETPLQHLARLAPQHSEQQLRDYLGGFAFHGDKVNELIGQFSGGEKARLVLALIIWQRPNLLLLDEPTNHLDLDMRQALTDALIDFSGALVVVSHDRHLLRATTDEFYLVDQGKVQQFNGDLADYQRWLAKQSVPSATVSSAPVSSGTVSPTSVSSITTPTRTTTSTTAPTRKQQKQQQAQQRALTQPLRNALNKLETQLEQLTALVTETENQLADSALYQPERKSELNDCLLRQRTLRADLHSCEQQWLEQQEALQQLEQRLTAGDND